MQYKRLGNIIAVVMASALGWTLTPGIRPIQAEQSDLLTSQSAPQSASPTELRKVATDIPAGVPGSDRKDPVPAVSKVGEPASAQANPQVNLQAIRQAGSPTAQPQAAIARVFPHNLKSRPAATIYVRGIPVLTFLGEAVANAGPATSSAVNSPSVTASAIHSSAAGEIRKLAAQETDENTPLWQATRLAAQLNQLHQSGDVDSSKISVKWDKDTYLVQMGGTTLVTLTSNIVLPDSTGVRTEDALQATNRLRRLLGNEAAEPLTRVADLPAPAKPKVVAAARTEGSFYQQGWASWYGPGFNGNQTANGEIFNQNAMTAAHLHLSFGSLVRVTNMDNGASVTVRINDRGPYAGDRVIDLSAAAADYIGLTHAGVAPVRIEVLK
ncbi:MAG: septal ring lytic transglycosylase RlpA family protein [Synechococcales cyanobacterium RU_4_20]|nr:septal ring lytic transglycosylase RlpA family protein [Synechococcales cyanobacterium RU_4_20]